MTKEIIISFELPSDDVSYKEYDMLVEDFMRGLELYCKVKDIIVTEEDNLEMRIR